MDTPRRVRLRCHFCHRVVADMLTWDAGESFMISNPVTPEEDSRPRRLVATATGRAQQRKGIGVHDVSDEAMSTGVYSSETERYKFVCAGKNHSTARIMRRETLWRDAAKALGERFSGEILI